MKNKIFWTVFLSFFQYLLITAIIFAGLNYFLNDRIPLFIIAITSSLIGILGAWLHYLLTSGNVKKHFILVLFLIAVEAFVCVASLFYFLDNNSSIYRIALQSVLASVFVVYCAFRVLSERKSNIKETN